MSSSLAPRAHPFDSISQATAFVSGLKVGAPVLLTTEPNASTPRTYAMRVSRGPMLSDVWYGYKGRMPRRYLLEEDSFAYALDRLREAQSVGEITGIRARYAMADKDPGTNGRGALLTPIWAAEHEALVALRLAELAEAVVA